MDRVCANCGTGLFYFNAEILPDLADMRSATYDEPEAIPAQVHIQVAERIKWMEHVHTRPQYERFPPFE